MINIINLNTIDRRKLDVPYVFACDRGTPLGNPFNISSTLTRDQACNKYHNYFYHSLNHTPLFRKAVIVLINAYKEHGELWLLCWCVPQRCHVTTIKDYIVGQVDDA